MVNTDSTTGTAVEGSTSRLDHVALVVTSLDSAMAFYSQLLGLEVLDRVDLGDHRIQYLSSGTHARMELIEYLPGKAAGAPAEPDAIAMRHLAWQVEDLAGLLPRVSELGGTVLTGPNWIPSLGFHSALIRDRDGIEVELVQRA